MTPRWVVREVAGPAPTQVLRGVRLLDPYSGVDGIVDVLIEEGMVRSVGHVSSAADEIDCHGMLALPCLLDLHVHLRFPGQPQKETIASGTAAAAAGGFGAVVAMANTDPVVDSVDVLEQVFARAALDATVRVAQVGAVSRDLRGQVAAPHEELIRSGAVALSDDGRNVHSPDVMRRALSVSAKTGVPVLVHAEDCDLAADGCMNLGRVSESLGVRGMDPAAEYEIVARDLDLLAAEGGRLHIQHVSLARTVELLRQAQGRGLSVTGEVTPHHLALTEDVVPAMGGRARVNPPLRTEADVAAVREAVADGTLTVIATDHAPHEETAKATDLSLAAPGYSGLETALPVILGLAAAGQLDLLTAIRAMTVGPCQVLGSGSRLLPAGVVAGAPADLTVIDPRPRTVDPAGFRSMGRTTPWAGQVLPGRTLLTWVAGRLAHIALEVPTRG